MAGLTVTDCCSLPCCVTRLGRTCALGWNPRLSAPPFICNACVIIIISFANYFVSAVKVGSMLSLRASVMSFLLARLLILAHFPNGANAAAWSFRKEMSDQNSLRSRTRLLPRFAALSASQDQRKNCINKGMLCSGHGRCQGSGSIFVCVCDVGWHSTKCDKLDVDNLVFNIPCNEMPSKFKIICKDIIPVTCHEHSLTIDKTCFDTCDLLRVMHGTAVDLVSISTLTLG